MNDTKMLFPGYWYGASMNEWMMEIHDKIVDKTLHLFDDTLPVHSQTGHRKWSNGKYGPQTVIHAYENGSPYSPRPPNWE